MDEEAHVHLAVHHGVLDRVEWSEDGSEDGLVQAKGQVGARERAGDRDPLASHIGPARGLTRDEPTSIPIAHRGAVRAPGVLVAPIGVGVEPDPRPYALAA